MVKGNSTQNAARDPERTRQNILEAALVEFSEKGLKGARISAIALRANTNYQALYYHFGNKEELYAAALESAITVRTDFNVAVDEIGALEALGKIIDRVFDAFYENTRNLSLLADENMHKAKHVDKMPFATKLFSEVIQTITHILSVGQREGTFREGLDPVLVFLSISGLASSFISSVPINSKVFRRKFDSKKEIEAWRLHVKTTLLAGLRSLP